MSSIEFTNDNELDFVELTNNVDVEYSDTFTLRIIDLRFDNLFPDDWCTDYSTFTSTITPGYVNNGYGLCNAI